MHKDFKALCKALDEIASAIESGSSDDQTFCEAWAGIAQRLPAMIWRHWLPALPAIFEARRRKKFRARFGNSLVIALAGFRLPNHKLFPNSGVVTTAWRFRPIPQPLRAFESRLRLLLVGSWFRILM